MLERYITGLLRYPGTVVLLSVAIIILLAAGASRLSVSNDFRVFFSDDNPQLAAFERLEETFNKQDNIFFLILPTQGDIYTKQTLSLVWKLTEAAWQIPYSRRVSSLSNYQHSYAQGDELVTVSLIETPDNLSKDSINRIRHITTSDATLRNLAPENSKATLVNVSLELPKDNLQANTEVYEYAIRLRSELSTQYPDVTILLAGSAPMNVGLEIAVERDLKTLVLTSYAVIILGLLLLLRSVVGTLVTLFVITFSVSGAMGIFGWFDYVLTPIAGFVPSVVMTIAVADAVHVLVSYFYCLQQGMARREAVRESMRINASPVFITSLTTIIGFLCLNFSDSPPYQDLGNMIAVGVFLAYLLSMGFLPACLLLLPVGSKHGTRGQNKVMDQFSGWVIKRHKILLVSVGISVVSLVSFIGNNELTERWHDYFDETFEVRRGVEAMNSLLSGVHAIYYQLDTGVAEGINDPDYLKSVDKFANWYRQQSGVAYVSSLPDTIKKLNKNMHGDDPHWLRLPERRDLTAQYLLLYELSLPLGLGLDDVINSDRSATRMVAVIKKTDSARLLELDRKAQVWLQQSVPEWKKIEGTGLDMVFAHINHRNINGMLKGTAVALVLISFVLIIALRSVRLGMISLLPNLAPAALAYGTWGLFVGRIDMSASVVICMSLGIIVDDTVHFLSKYLRARRENNLDINEGMRYAFHTVGTALCITTVVLVAGFMVLAASHFSPTWVTGLLLSVTLAFALVVDFLLLPPLLILLDKHAYRN